MYRDVAPFDPDGILQDEFLNSRGAIPRFGRGSIEIRVIDVQESPFVDLAIAALTVGALRLLAEEDLSTLAHQQALVTPPLVSVFLDSIRVGEKAVVADPGYLKALGVREKKLSAQEVWWHLFERVNRAGFLSSKEDADRVAGLLRRGTLASQILRALDVPEGHRGGPHPVIPRTWLQEVYAALGECLEEGDLFVV
jgi:hypothetical protein